MGQKVNPIGFRVSVNHDWRSRWFADKRSFGDFLAEDCMIRDYIKDKARSAALASIQIERAANRVRIQILTARPGVLMSAKAKDDKTLLLDEMKQYLLKKTGKKIFFQIDEIRDQDANAQLIAENIADQLVRRVTLKRAMKRAQKTAMDLGVDGIKMLACGRIGGAELSRTEWMKEGRVPLHTLRAHIEYGFAEAKTTAGLIGVKVWVCKSEHYQPRTQKRRNSHAANA